MPLTPAVLLSGVEEAKQARAADVNEVQRSQGPHQSSSLLEKNSARWSTSSCLSCRRLDTCRHAYQCVCLIYHVDYQLLANLE